MILVGVEGGGCLLEDVFGHRLPYPPWSVGMYMPGCKQCTPFDDQVAGLPKQHVTWPGTPLPGHIQITWKPRAQTESRRKGRHYIASWLNWRQFRQFSLVRCLSNADWSDYQIGNINRNSTGKFMRMCVCFPFASYQDIV